MTQREALDAYRAMFPDRAAKLKVEREHSIGYKYGHMDSFNLWDFSGPTSQLIQSPYSWEHALATAKSGNEDLWPQDDSPVESEVA
jgi:hypothetical protein